MALGTSLRAARLLIDAPASGPRNMAVDEALLMSAAALGKATLRFYAWSEPTLSLGYFQSYRERRSHPASLPGPLVRRATGGGAILHDRELTYSFVAPIADRLSGDVERLYYAFHETLIEALAELSVVAALCDSPVDAPRGEEPFLCFQRRTCGDVLLGPHKIAGSAQRRHHGAVLQHGSILLARSPAAPELPGIEELTGIDFSVEQLTAAWQPKLARRLQTAWETGELHSAEQTLANELAAGKFAAIEWNERR